MGAFLQIKMGMDDNGIAFPGADDLLFFHISTEKRASDHIYLSLDVSLYSQDFYLSLHSVRPQ